MAEVDFGKVQRRQWPGQHLLEHWLDGLLDHVAAVSIDVGPELLDDVVEEFWRRTR